MFRISPIEQVYYHISFWIFIAALLWFSIVLVIHFPGIIRKALREDKREQLEKLLQEQNKTLTALENNLAEIQKSSASNPEEFEKIIEQIPEPDSLEEETAAEDTYEVNLDSPKDESESAEAKIIELKSVHTDFILLDPEENYSIKPKHANRPKLDDSTEKIRNRAFRPEVLNLLKDVQTSTPETADSITQRIIEFTNRWQKPEVNEWSVFLNEVYFDEVTTEEVENLLATLIDYVEADSAALLSNNLFLGCYETFVSIRMPEESENLLYALSRDPHIFMSPERNLRTDVSKELKENLFFAKRFKPEFIQPLKEIYALPMISQGLDAYLLLFYNRVMPEHMMDVLTSTAFKRHLRELTPALKYFLQD
ncbi:MAG: hypothetical protein KDK38_16725, partial [Leptospiraceae bacterium]|nr:hypothetical protein [Leptospiraceae bacterium]